MKKFLIVGVLAIALVMAMNSVALANFGPHGGYDAETDACAGCHRAHTSFSAVARTVYGYDTNGDYVALGSGAEGSALLTTSAENMLDFCYACHGEGAPGASTNVEMGVFDSGPSASSVADGSQTGGVTELYATDSVFNATLNGGGFAYVNGTVATSQHNMLQTPATDIVWGLGQSAATSTMNNFGCTSCHDPHGDSNYRLLKSTLLVGGSFGGYNSSGNPTPWVLSAEIGAPTDGFEKGVVYNGTYLPNYTTAYWRNSGNPNESFSGWCAGCHEQYGPSTNNDYAGGSYMASTYDYGTSMESSSGVAATVGARTMHRHPVNVSLEAGDIAGNLNASLGTQITLDSALPLELKYTKSTALRGTQDFDDTMGCLTCHFAHGTSATMTGWATSALEATDAVSTTATWYPVLVAAGTRDGVNPTNTSALLRIEDRGVCEHCHNK